MYIFVARADKSVKIGLFEEHDTRVTVITTTNKTRTKGNFSKEVER